ncbi:MAG: hypothetical protein A2600_12050 [Candidatus Lambdaproteobacteria bacterium RIFOXYD1_FULL_56_27]|uniref:Uncharacterized protein n=1 Tax=Candidatus Lambdaproteobacteria bacterium RIFOXYD2_FULL_56_26 TaxID=1817773 RepID=A0A1F6GXE4_9PROT|nr:MAG: hypothetical protein A2426_08915 [Candidatus Lambdaproteobacteria bacterium RIFOXYC1_FULL_56_13]OGH02700.1 MAG: hypothetical protein A2557_11495 [Candidatus Lambdaproteobacteria bacterium RIFOXYD2_FULL_56_26]OGH07979.1 MAG: hypothetical protein A2600_12050 [Candidatus Lambdaproteobacteria bacterium RIFOXYD1_FULL_56_27]
MRTILPFFLVCVCFALGQPASAQTEGMTLFGWSLYGQTDGAAYLDWVLPEESLSVKAEIIKCLDAKAASHPTPEELQTSLDTLIKSCKERGKAL